MTANNLTKRYLMPSEQLVLEWLAPAPSCFVSLLPARSSLGAIPNISTFPRRSLFSAYEADEMAFIPLHLPRWSKTIADTPILPFSPLLSGVVV